MPFGSHLYGTNTEQSDADYKGVFIPTEEEILTGKIPKHLRYNSKENKRDKNTSKDIDIEMYSLHYFLELASKGETIGIDMLHCPEPFSIITSTEWQYLRKHRAEFYTKNLQAFVGYCRRQAAKYGIKGSRLSAAKRVADFLWDSVHSDKIDTTRLKHVWEHLPTGEHIHFIDKNEITPFRMYQVCGKYFLETVSIKEVYLSLRKFYDEYGHRAKLAEQNQGIDWKAISHALRAANQLLQIYTIGDIVYPLHCAQYLKDVKQGKLDYQSDVAPTLEEIMNKVEKLSELCTLPEKINRKRWEGWLCDTIKKYLT
ncbi:hypothetical protein A2619_01190 [candidate division WWE3 bacterium RIFOXYD1_FULL_39_9]|uniref:Nucleotidyltransferase n=1 Tax=candidate division WWE3 bacterium RIFOXYD1_FULL_39_9 TaxID=1802649 RepID=A0A1F4X674_UNCKA|nr:MAG: hypothetical protein A2619_01190 [candidate division WWE3 bacterium RIFOXYD1_FULL_39_9]